MIYLVADARGSLALFIGDKPVYDENSGTWVSPRREHLHFEEVSRAELRGLRLPIAGEMARLFSICLPTEAGLYRCPFYDDADQSPACDFVPGGKTDPNKPLPEALPFVQLLVDSKEANRRADICKGYCGADCFWRQHNFSVPEVPVATR